MGKGDDLVPETDQETEAKNGKDDSIISMGKYWMTSREKWWRMPKWN